MLQTGVEDGRMPLFDVEDRPILLISAEDILLIGI